MVGRLAFVLGVVACAGACSGGGGKPADGGADAIYDVGLEWPSTCPPEAGNDKGVGARCTRGGGECQNGLRCTCDPALGTLLAGVPCLCTFAQPAQNGSTDPCADSVAPDFCGSNATCCDVLNSYAYCVPNDCLIGGACLVFVAADGGT
jgi:hypothetical protein